MGIQAIPGVPLIPEGYNPATWVLEVTSASMEDKLGIDFATVYEQSELYRSVGTPHSMSRRVAHTLMATGWACRRNMAMVEELSEPQPGNAPLRFDSRCERRP